MTGNSKILAKALWRRFRKEIVENLCLNYDDFLIWIDIVFGLYNRQVDTLYLEADNVVHYVV